MDKDILNGIPEDEITDEIVEDAAEEESAEEAVQEPADTEELEAETTETEQTAPESDEKEETAQEATETEEDTEEAETVICAACGENEAAEGSNYCAECETKMLKRRIPFGAWIVTLLTLSFSFFAFVVALLSSLPTLQIARGDGYARDKNWYGAYLEYSAVSDVTYEVNTTLGIDSPYTKTGLGLSKRLVKAVANYMSPVDAYGAAQSLITNVDLNKLGFMKKYSKIYNEHMDTYEIIYETIGKAYDEGATAEKIYAELDSFKGKEGVTDLYVNFYKFALSNQLGVDSEGRLELLRELEKSCLAKGNDYGWVYCLPLAQELAAAGENEEALKYVDMIIKQDTSKYDAYYLKMDIELNQGDVDAASKTLAEFKVNNEEYETAYMLEIIFLRRTGKTEEAKSLCIDVLGEYDTVPEIHRQLALVYLTEGDYVNAFDTMSQAYNMAYMIYQYTGNSGTLDDPRFYNTYYLSAYLLNNSDQMKEEYKESVEVALGQLDEDVLEEATVAIINGEKTVEQVLTEGACDLA